MADSQDRQKEQDDAKRRGCIESYKVGDQVLLHAKNLPTNVASAVFKTKLCSRSIRPFTVVANKGLSYTLNLPRKLRTHSVFYVVILKPYRDPNDVKVEALTPRAATSELGRQTDPPFEAAAFTAPAAASSPLPAYLESKTKFHGVVSPREVTQRALAPIHQLQPALLDEQGNLQFHVKKLL